MVLGRLKFTSPERGGLVSNTAVEQGSTTSSIKVDSIVTEPSVALRAILWVPTTVGKVVTMLLNSMVPPVEVKSVVETCKIEFPKDVPEIVNNVAALRQAGVRTTSKGILKGRESIPI